MMKNAINRYENPWQEFQYIVQTLDDSEFENIDVSEIKEVLNEGSAIRLGDAK